jgi:hypothetical protein
MQSRTFATLAAVIVDIGVAGAALPGLIDAGVPVGYLRATSHGRKGTTTSAGNPGWVREHRWRNEAMPIARDPDAFPMVIPESGGTPRETP